MSKADALRGLEILTSRKTISIDQLFPDPILQGIYPPIAEFVDNIANGTKPETTSHDFFRDFVRDVLKVSNSHEARIEKGFVDFVLTQDNSNPILFELKPLFLRDKGNKQIYADILTWKNHGAQVTKYLKTNEYVILTDLKHAYLFNRQALVDYQFFEEMPFLELTQRFLASENLVDALRRIEDQTVKVDLDKSFL